MLRRAVVSARYSLASAVFCQDWQSMWQAWSAEQALWGDAAGR